MTSKALIEIDFQGWVVATAHRDPTTEAARLRSSIREAGGIVVCTRYLGEIPDGVIRLPEPDEDTAFVPAMAPAPGDLVLSKYSQDICDNPDLVANLALRGVRDVVISGVLTEFGVAVAARSLKARGFGVQVVGEACAGHTEAGHNETLAQLARDGIPNVGACAGVHSNA